MEYITKKRIPPHWKMLKKAFKVIDCLHIICRSQPLSLVDYSYETPGILQVTFQSDLVTGRKGRKLRYAYSINLAIFPVEECSYLVAEVVHEFNLISEEQMKVIRWQDQNGQLHKTEEAQVIKDLEIDMDNKLNRNHTLYDCSIDDIVEFVSKNKNSFDRLLEVYEGKSN